MYNLSLLLTSRPVQATRVLASRDLLSVLCRFAALLQFRMSSTITCALCLLDLQNVLAGHSGHVGPIMLSAHSTARDYRREFASPPEVPRGEEISGIKGKRE